MFGRRSKRDNEATVNLKEQKQADREWDFEARCIECGKQLDMVLTVSSQYLVLLRINKVCEEHPKKSVILWPQGQSNIIRIEYDRGEGWET